MANGDWRLAVFWLPAFAVRRSPFAVRRSPFAVRRSPFAVRRSPFAVRPLIIDPSPCDDTPPSLLFPPTAG
jgi:hypothetical protein